MGVLGQHPDRLVHGGDFVRDLVEKASVGGCETSDVSAGPALVGNDVRRAGRFDVDRGSLLPDVARVRLVLVHDSGVVRIGFLPCFTARKIIETILLLPVDKPKRLG